MLRKKMFSKFLIAILCISMILGVTACGIKDPSGTTPGTDTSLESISVAAAPKTSYLEEQPFDPEGGVLTLKYNGGKEDESLSMTDSAVSFSGYSANTVGNQTITITYAQKTTTLPVTVSAAAVGKVSIKSAPSKSEYYIGEQLALSGGVITVTYSNGKTEDVAFTASGVTVSSLDSSAYGSKTVTVTYGEKSATFKVAVRAADNALDAQTAAINSLPGDTSGFTPQQIATAQTALDTLANLSSGAKAVVDEGLAEKIIATNVAIDTAAVAQTQSYVMTEMENLSSQTFPAANTLAAKALEMQEALETFNNINDKYSPLAGNFGDISLGDFTLSDMTGNIANLLSEIAVTAAGYTQAAVIEERFSSLPENAGVISEGNVGTYEAAMLSIARGFVSGDPVEQQGMQLAISITDVNHSYDTEGVVMAFAAAFIGGQGIDVISRLLEAESFLRSANSPQMLMAYAEGSDNFLEDDILNFLTTVTISNNVYSNLGAAKKTNINKLIDTRLDDLKAEYDLTLAKEIYGKTAAYGNMYRKVLAVYVLYYGQQFVQTPNYSAFMVSFGEIIYLYDIVIDSATKEQVNDRLYEPTYFLGDFFHNYGKAHYTALSAPATLTINGNTVSWAAVANASAYRLEIRLKNLQNGEAIKRQTVASVTSFDMNSIISSLTNGAVYQIFVNAIGDYVTYFDSDNRGIDFTAGADNNSNVSYGGNQGGENPGGENPGGENPGGENPGGENKNLAAPTGLSIDANMIASWNAVSGAAYYMFMISDPNVTAGSSYESSYAFRIETNSFDISTVIDDLLNRSFGGKTANVSVQASTDKGPGSSDFSPAVQWTVPTATLISPELTIDSDTKTLSWEAVSGAAFYQVVFNNGPLGNEIKPKQTALSFSLAGMTELGSSCYISVKAYGNTADIFSLSASISYTVRGPKLGAPSGLAYDADTNSVKWDAVDNSDGYELDINGFNYLINGTRPMEAVPTSFSLDFITANGTYDIKMRAKADKFDFSDSEWTLAIQYVKNDASAPVALDVPANIVLIGNTLFFEASRPEGYWSAYALELKYGTVVEELYSFDEGYVDLSDKIRKAGTYSVSLRAKGDINVMASNWSDAVSYTRPAGITQMQISNLRIEGKMLKWDSVPNATSFLIKYNQTNITVTANSFDLSGLTDSQYYYITVYALSTDAAYGMCQSSVSYEIIVPPALAPSNVRVEGNILKWDAVSGAERYIVKANGVEIQIPGIINTNQLDLSLYLTYNGTYTLSVCTAGTYLVSADSSYTNSANTYTVTGGMAAVPLSVPTDIKGSIMGSGMISVFWTPVLGSNSGYEIEINGTVFPTMYIGYSDAFSGTSASVRVRALGNGISTANSDWSEYITITGTEIVKP